MEERRQISRERTLKAGKIAFNHDSSVIDCVIRNRSATGACLQVESPLGVPDRFDLVLEADHARKPCRVIWRGQKRIGVAFG